MSSTKRSTVVERPPTSRWALDAMASNTGCTSYGELAMTFNISAVAACCSRASFRSLFGSEAERRLARVAAGAMRVGLGGLAALRGLALRVFASLVLPPVLDGRAISAPRDKKCILSGKTVLQEGGELGLSRIMPAGGLESQLPLRFRERGKLASRT